MPIKPLVKAAGLGLALLSLGCATPRRETATDSVRDFRLRFLADLHIPTGQAPGDLDPALFGGLSSLSYDPVSGVYVALSDVKEDCRLYRFRITVAQGVLEARPLGVIYLKDGAGRSFPQLAMDPEGLAVDGAGMMYITSEGRGVSDLTPAVYLFRPDGSLARDIAVPEKFLPAPEGSAPRGGRPNESFEALTLTPDHLRLFTAGESSLFQDGDSAQPEKGCLARILEYDLGGPEPKPVAEYAYPLEAVAKPAGFGPGEGNNGLVELLALGGREFLSMERSFFSEYTDGPTRRSRTRIRIFRVRLDGADDISGLPSLEQAAPPRPVDKRLLIDLDDIVRRLKPGFRSLDNFEAMCFGPMLPDGHGTLLLMSDNNFSPIQRTAFLAFEIVPR